MLEITRGKKVVARDCANTALVRYLWDIGDSCFYLCSEEQLHGLLRGKEETPAIGFPKCDVFQYYDGVHEVINDNKDWWTQLRPIN